MWSWPLLGEASTMLPGVCAASPISTPKWGQIGPTSNLKAGGSGSLSVCLLASLSLWTAQSPGQVSVIDVILVISGKDANQAAEQLRYLVTRCREVQEIFMYFRFSSRSAKNACHQCPRHRRGHYAPNKRTQPRLEVRWQSSCADGCAETICLESI